MKRRHGHNGLTLTELVVVIAVMAILLGISVPTAQKLMNSFEHSAGTAGLIDAALSGARAIAVSSSSNNQEAGIRFQQDRNGDFYMIFIIHDPAATGLVQGFKAVEGRKPIKLPSTIGVMDGSVSKDADLNTPAGRMNAQTFSVIFSQQGQQVTLAVRTRNKNGATDDSSRDPVFNTKTNVDGNAAGMFYQDDYSAAPQDLGLGEENSIHTFYIYEKKRLQEAGTAPYTGYIQHLQKKYVNPYTGQLIGK